MRILITGSRGQLGSALAERLARLAHHTTRECARPDCDVADSGQVRPAILAARPELVIHCAAWTDVDGCAIDPARAYRINGLGAQTVALACAEAGAALLYVSTNEVFDGSSLEPYSEFDIPRPINAYGRSKLAGEWFATHLLTRFYVVRTSWLYAPGGHNFLHKVLQLAHDRRQAGLRVVTDEVATPTHVGDLADAIVRLIATGRFGVYHLTNAGHCSRYDWARAALELTGRGDTPLQPITRADYPRPSNPPAFAALANNLAAALGITLRPWEEALAEFLQ